MSNSHKPLAQQSDIDFWAEVDHWRPSPEFDPIELRALAAGLVHLRALNEELAARRDWFERETRDASSVYFCVDDEQRERLLERRELYQAVRTPWVPRGARWDRIERSIGRPQAGRIIDAAIVSIVHENPSLDGGFPLDYARPELPRHTLDRLIARVSELGADKLNRAAYLRSLFLEQARACGLASGDGTVVPLRPRSYQQLVTPRPQPMSKLLERLDDQLKELDRLLQRSAELRSRRE